MVIRAGVGWVVCEGTEVEKSFSALNRGSSADIVDLNTTPFAAKA